jgi:hypothetical protein
MDARYRSRYAWTVLTLVAALVLGLAAVAHAAKAQKTNGTAYVGVTHTEGSTVFVSGDFKDDVLGSGAIVYQTTVGTGPEPESIKIDARKVTIYTKKGSLSGTGSAVQTNNPDGTSVLTDGEFNLTKGTGAYKGRSLKGTFDGTYADGVYTYDYEATFK